MSKIIEALRSAVEHRERISLDDIDVADLLAEVDRLSADAARYKFIRASDNARQTTERAECSTETGRADMTDRELLELAAKAAGVDGEYADDDTHDYDVVGPYNGDGIYRPWVGCGFGVIWNPLEEDGDALRLAVQMGIDILITASESGGETTTYGTFKDAISVASERYVEPHTGDPYAATRRAIVRAAAAAAPKPGDMDE